MSASTTHETVALESKTIKAPARAEPTSVENELELLNLATRSKPAQMLKRVLVAFMAAIVAILVFVPWQQNVPGTGRVIAYAPQERQQVIEAPIEGRLTSWNVHEGARVHKGDILCEIADNDPAIMDRLGQEISAQKVRIDQARLRAKAVEERIASLEGSRKNAGSAADSRVKMAQERVTQANQLVVGAEGNVKTAELNFERQKGLFEQGLSSKRQFELAELDLVRARSEAERLRSALSASRGEQMAYGADQMRVMNDVTAQINDAHAQRASALSEEASASAELARTEVRIARQRAQTVTAPRDGTVLHVIARQGGEIVKAGDALMTFVPDTDARAVELYVDGNDVPLLREGRTVRLQFEGWPAVQFAGWPQVAVGTFGGTVALVDAADSGDGKFRIVVVPDGNEAWPADIYLRQGTRVNGWVILERVRLGYEIWRKFNGFPPSITPPGAPAAKDGKGKK